MSFVSELDNTNSPANLFSEKDLSYFEHRFTEHITAANKRYHDNMRVTGRAPFSKEAYGYYGKSVIDYHKDSLVSNTSGLLMPTFLPMTHNGCRVLESCYYRGSIFPFPTYESAAYCKGKMEQLFIRLGFSRYEVQIEQVYFSWQQSKGGVLFKDKQVRMFDSTPSFIVYAHVAW